MRGPSTRSSWEAGVRPWTSALAPARRGGPRPQILDPRVGCVAAQESQGGCVAKKLGWAGAWKRPGPLLPGCRRLRPHLVLPCPDLRLCGCARGSGHCNTTSWCGWPVPAVYSRVGYSSFRQPAGSSAPSALRSCSVKFKQTDIDFCSIIQPDLAPRARLSAGLVSFVGKRGPLEEVQA